MKIFPTLEDYFENEIHAMGVRITDLKKHPEEEGELVNSVHTEKNSPFVKNEQIVQ
ncbi:MAG: hypothetical protein OCC49_01400 [Fibrobacterales bacterium]